MKAYFHIVRKIGFGVRIEMDFSVVLKNDGSTS